MGDGKESDVEAGEALVFLAVGVKGTWKQPLGYYFIKGVSAKAQSELVRHILEKLIEAGVIPLSITMDGHATNVSTARKLGCSLKPDNLRSWFACPSSPFGRVFVFFDACHMVKLVRNMLASCGELMIPDCGVVRWDHLVKLNALQNQEGLRAGNKLSDRHIQWETQKMKVG